MYDTAFRNLSDRELHCFCHSSNWEQLSPEARLQVCQELHNRYADEHHMERCEVTAEPMRGTLFGEYDPSSGSIHLNQSVLEDGTIVTQNGEHRAYEGSNAETIDTLFHETSHAYDDQLAQAAENHLEGAQANTELLNDAQLRNLDVDLTRASNSIYITKNEDMYRVQDCEKRAFEAGESETRHVMDDAVRVLGRDEQYETYQQNLELNAGYNESLDNLKAAYHDNDIAQTLNEQTKAMYYGDTGVEDGNQPSGTPQSRAAVNEALQATPMGQAISIMDAHAEHYQADSDSAVSQSHEQESGVQSDGSVSASDTSAQADDDCDTL